MGNHSTFYTNSARITRWAVKHIHPLHSANVQHMNSSLSYFSILPRRPQFLHCSNICLPFGQLTCDSCSHHVDLESKERGGVAAW
jgi:hypothetical protein